MSISIEDKILDLYAMKGSYILPSLREREAIRLLNIIDGLNFAGIVDAEIPEFYIKTLQIIISAAQLQNEDWQAYMQAEKEIQLWLADQTLSENED